MKLCSSAKTSVVYPYPALDQVMYKYTNPSSQEISPHENNKNLMILSRIIAGLFRARIQAKNDKTDQNRIALVDTSKQTHTYPFKLPAELLLGLLHRFHGQCLGNLSGASKKQGCILIMK